jgi:hypothetical protein
VSCFRDRHVNQLTDRLCLSRVWLRLSVAAYPVCLVVPNQDREPVLIAVLIVKVQTVTVLSVTVQIVMAQNVMVQNATAQNATVPTVMAQTLMAQTVWAQIEVTPIVTVPTLVIRSVMEARSYPDAKVSQEPHSGVHYVALHSAVVARSVEAELRFVVVHSVEAAPRFAEVHFVEGAPRFVVVLRCAAAPLFALVEHFFVVVHRTALAFQCVAPGGQVLYVLDRAPACPQNQDYPVDQFESELNLPQYESDS